MKRPDDNALRAALFELQITSCALMEERNNNNHNNNIKCYFVAWNFWTPLYMIFNMTQMQSSLSASSSLWSPHNSCCAYQHSHWACKSVFNIEDSKKAEPPTCAACLDDILLVPVYFHFSEFCSHYICQDLLSKVTCSAFQIEYYQYCAKCTLHCLLFVIIVCETVCIMQIWSES